MRRVAVVGSGISGLAVAHGLSGHAQVTLFESADYFGGHTHSVDLALDGMSHPVDTGFLVLNARTYPKLMRLLATLEVPIAASEMSFSVQVPDLGLEWSGCNLNTVFAQRANLARPAFWRMLADVVRFNRLATALAASGGCDALEHSIGEFLSEHRFGATFRDWYFLPMIGCIWSCPVDQMLEFPVATMIRFCHNHGLLQLSQRPQWYTVPGGARTYVHKMLGAVPDARLNTPVRQIQRALPGDPDRSVRIATDAGTERFDAVVLACHSDQALALLADPSAAERRVLGAIRYHPNRAVLHSDTTVLPPGTTNARRTTRASTPRCVCTTCSTGCSRCRFAPPSWSRSIRCASRARRTCTPRSTTRTRCSTAPPSSRSSSCRGCRASATPGSAVPGPATGSTKTV